MDKILDPTLFGGGGDKTGRPRRRWVFSWPIRRETEGAALAREVAEGVRSVNSARRELGLKPWDGPEDGIRVAG